MSEIECCTREWQLLQQWQQVGAVVRGGVGDARAVDHVAVVHQEDVLAQLRGVGARALGEGHEVAERAAELRAEALEVLSGVVQVLVFAVGAAGERGLNLCVCACIGSCALTISGGG